MITDVWNSGDYDKDLRDISEMVMGEWIGKTVFYEVGPDMELEAAD